MSQVRTLHKVGGADFSAKDRTPRRVALEEQVSSPTTKKLIRIMSDRPLTEEEAEEYAISVGIVIPKRFAQLKAAIKERPLTAEESDEYVKAVVQRLEAESLVMGSLFAQVKDEAKEFDSKEEIIERKIEQRSVAELADQFDSWMKVFVESHKESGHYEDNNKALIDWLGGDGGDIYIKNYSQFCELAGEAQKRGYSTNPPPSESIFDEAMRECCRYRSSKNY